MKVATDMERHVAHWAPGDWQGVVIENRPRDYFKAGFFLALGAMCVLPAILLLVFITLTVLGASL